MFLFANISVSRVPSTILRSDIVIKEAIPRNFYCKIDLKCQVVPFALELIPPSSKIQSKQGHKTRL